MKTTLKRFWPYIRSYKFYFFLVIVGILMVVSATAATAYILQPLIDEVLIKQDAQMLVYVPFFIVGIYLVKSFGRYIQAVFTNRIGLHIVTRLRTDLLNKMLRMDMGYLYANRSGELISRIVTDIARVQYFVSNMLPEFTRETLTVVALVGYIIYLNPLLAFYALVVLPLVVYPIIYAAKRLKRLSHRSQEKNADVVSRLTEVFNNNEIIKANATETYEVTRFDEENWRFFNITMKAVYTKELIGPILEVVGAIGLAGVVYVGGKVVLDQQMTPGELISFMGAVGMVFQPMRRVGTIYAKIQDAIAAGERVFKVMDQQAGITDGQKELKSNITSISCRDVSLSYGDKQALKHIFFEAKQGQTIALVGDSGGGKSSLINLLMRFYDPAKGEILFNGEAIGTFTQASLREHIALVSQRVYIFQDSLAANVAYGHEIDEARVMEALRLADAESFVEQLPEGIHTLMEEAGANLSGGQRQRLAIARAIYKHASLFILDEATSALDNESEKRIQNALDAYAKDKITVMIAHRLSTVEHADAILLFKEGEIVARGTHAKLLESSEEYRRLAGAMEK